LELKIIKEMVMEEEMKDEEGKVMVELLDRLGKVVEKLQEASKGGVEVKVEEMKDEEGEVAVVELHGREGVRVEKLKDGQERMLEEFKFGEGKVVEG